MDDVSAFDSSVARHIRVWLFAEADLCQKVFGTCCTRAEAEVEEEPVPA